MALSKAKMKTVVSGVKVALESVLEDIDVFKTKYTSFREALFDNLPDKAKNILEKHEKKTSRVDVENVIADAIGELGGDDILNQFTEKILGLNISSVKKAVEYSGKRSEFNNLINQLSGLTKLDRTSLILSMDYSKDVDDRIDRVKIILDSVAKNDTEV